MRFNLLFSVIFFLSSTLPSKADVVEKPNHTISGYIKDASNGENLPGATVYVREISNGTVTNAYGFYSLTLPEGSYTIEYRFIGYVTQVIEVILDKNIRKDVELAEENLELEEVVIKGTPEDANVTSVEMSTNKLDINTIEKIPAFLGEVDILRSIQFLPGVSTVGEGAAGFNVRGGNVGQNLVLLDEAPVYNSSHLLGFFSVFNPDAVQDLKLYKGAMPARFGGRLASVLDIRMKDGNKKEFEANGGIGTIFSRLTLEAPIIKDRWSFIAAGRRSYGDILARPFTDVLDDGAALNFYDLTLKTNYDINDNNRIFLSGYLGRDNFLFDANQGFSWGNTTATLRWNKIFSDRLFSNFTAYFSDYDYSLAFGENNLDRFEWKSRIRTTSFKPEFTYFFNSNNEITFGAEVNYYKFNPAEAVGISNGESTDISLDEKYGVESAIYLANEQKIGEVVLQYGLRGSSFSYMGPGNVYEFQETIPGRRKLLVSASTAGRRETISTYYNLEPRFAIKIPAGPSSSIKASYNRTAQYIHLISNTTASNPLDVWTPSTNNIEPQTGNQYTVGYFRNFGLGNKYETSLETYYRDAQNQIDYIDGADLLINEFLEADLLSGIGRAYGLELQVKKNTGNLNGWISYTLARTELKVEGINEGNWYPTRFDQTHNLKIAAFYDLNERWQLSGNFTYVTGTPTTFPTSRFTIQNFVVPHNAFDSRNNIRIPDFHRLDLSVTLQGKKYRKGKERKNEDYWVFSIYNAYARRNPFSYNFSQLDGRPSGDEPVVTQATRISIIGTIVPAVSYNFKF